MKSEENFNQLSSEIIDREKKARLIEHLKMIASEGDFVELPSIPQDSTR